MPMNSEVKAKLVTALRSGKYEQARNQLRKGDAFCCLGVLCDVLDPNGWQGEYHQGRGGLPSDKIGAASGLVSLLGTGFFKAPKVVIDGEERELDAHNDDGKTFAQIADAIEAQL